jgi:uncharacterized protein with von Willebrand factor type A (vWA) domain
MAGRSTRHTVLIAGAANVFVGTIKRAAGIMVGASAMLAEAAHSAADRRQDRAKIRRALCCLLIGQQGAKRPQIQVQILRPQAEMVPELGHSGIEGHQR